MKEDIEIREELQCRGVEEEGRRNIRRMEE